MKANQKRSGLIRGILAECFPAVIAEYA